MHTAGATAPAFALDILEFDQIRQQLARHASFSAGRELALALEPTAEFDAQWGAGFMNPENFVAVVYNSL